MRADLMEEDQRSSDPDTVGLNSDSPQKERLLGLEEELKKLSLLLQQKDSAIQLLEREKKILEKEKHSLKIETESAVKDKETAVIRFASKEKDLLDLKREKDAFQKELIDTKREINNIKKMFMTLSDEKTRVMGMLDEKCNELKRQQKSSEKLKADFNNLEMKLKWNVIKLNQETESRQALEKRLEEVSASTPKNTPKVTEQQRMEQEANMILLKHEIEEKDKTIEHLKRDHQDVVEKLKKLEENFEGEVKLKNELSSELKQLKEEHNTVQDSLSQEILVSAQLRTELEASKILKAQHAINEEKIKTLESSAEEKDQRISDCDAQVFHLRNKEAELLSINKEMSEMIVDLQNQIYLQESKLKAIEAEKSLLHKERLDFDTRLRAVDDKLKEEIEKRNEERLALARHLSEKTKQYETTKIKFDNAVGDLEATKKKHTQVLKELHRELNKYRKQCTDQPVQNCADEPGYTVRSQNSTSSQGDGNQSNSPSPQNTLEGRTVQEPSKEHLVERILRLQQAAVRQTEKIDFLENHTMSLVAELQKKSKILQYYMLRDQAGALTSSKSDQNKTELAKYGGVMSAIYTGIRGNNQSMTLDLSLEINKKLQAVLEDTLLKNITLKENLDVLGLEVDKLTRQLAKIGANKYAPTDPDQQNRKSVIN